MKVSNKISGIILFCIVILASFFRLYKLDFNPPSLFADEVDIGYQVRSFLTTGKDYQGNILPLQFHSFSDVRTSLPIYSTALVSLIPKVTIDRAIRLTPALFSILSIILIYFLTNNLFSIFKLSSDKLIKPGVWSALILSFLPWHYTYSRVGFELSMLLVFILGGIFLYTKFINTFQKRYLIFSLILLSLAPMIYSTAKLTIIFYPFILLLIPGSISFFKNRKNYLFLFILFIPLLILFLNGGAGKRFSEITIFTDPTISTEVGTSRQVDLGPNSVVGSTPGLQSKIIHNKVISVVKVISDNLINTVSLDFLFKSGDPNQRHALKGWGMLEKSLLIPIILGLYSLISKKHTRFLQLIFLLWFSAVAPSILTRDGGTHASRNFMMILPLILLISIGINLIVNRSKLLLLLFIGLFIIESFYYLHDYWYHYQYDSQRDWHYGLKQAVQNTQKYTNRPLIISSKYEPPLIFYLYYTDFPAAKFQTMFKTNSIYSPVDKKLNIEGDRLAGTDIYFASVADKNLHDPFIVKDGVYVVTHNEYLETGELSHYVDEVIKFPSGYPVFYILNTNKDYR